MGPLSATETNRKTDMGWTLKVFLWKAEVLLLLSPKHISMGASVLYTPEAEICHRKNPGYSNCQKWLFSVTYKVVEARILKTEGELYAKLCIYITSDKFQVIDSETW